MDQWKKAKKTIRARFNHDDFNPFVAGKDGVLRVPLLQTRDFVRCGICGKDCKRITFHLIKAHGLRDFDIYKRKFGEFSTQRGKYRNGKFVKAYDLNREDLRRGSVGLSLKYHGVEEADYVVCRMCGARRKNLGKHITIAHRITVSEYNARFGKHSLMCNETKMKCAGKTPNKLELSFASDTPEYVVFTGDGKYYVSDSKRAKTRIPDFVVYHDKKKFREYKKGTVPNEIRTNLVVELFGNLAHSPHVTGVSRTKHEQDYYRFYERLGITCLIFWEEDVRNDIAGCVRKIDGAIDRLRGGATRVRVKQKVEYSKVSCKYCKKAFSSVKGEEKFTIRRHIKACCYRPKAVEPRDYVECRICGGRFMKLGIHLVETHGCTVDEYVKRFNDAPTISGKMSKRISSSNKVRRHFKEYVCTECGEKFHNRLKYEKHLRGHNSAPRFSGREGVDFVTCLECGWVGKELQAHLRKHEMALDEYRGKYDDALVRVEGGGLSERGDEELYCLLCQMQREGARG